MTDQSTIEAVAVAIYNSSKHLELYQLDEESRNWAMLHARNNAKAAIETLKSLGWQPPQPTCSTCRHWRMQPNTSNAEVPWGECWINATLERLPAMFGNESCSSHSQPPQPKDT